MSKAKIVRDSAGKFYAGKPHWSFNGHFEKPVLGLSVLQTWDEWQGDGVPAKKHVCHSFVWCNGAQPGQITLLGDCTHGLAGQTVDLPDAVDGDE